MRAVCVHAFRKTRKKGKWEAGLKMQQSCVIVCLRLWCVCACVWACENTSVTTNSREACSSVCLECKQLALLPHRLLMQIHKHTLMPSLPKQLLATEIASKGDKVTTNEALHG